MPIHREGHERADVGEGIESALLVRLEDSGRDTPFRAHRCQEIGGHRLAINHEVGQMQHFDALFVAGEHSRNPVG